MQLTDPPAADVTETMPVVPLQCGVWHAECGVAMKGRSPSDARVHTPHSALRIPHSALGAPTDLVQLFQSHQHVPRLRSVCGPQDPCELELIDDARGTPVSDAHATLQQGCRAELVLDADLGGLPEQGVPLAGRALVPASLVPRFFRLFERGDLLVDAPAPRPRGDLRRVRLVP